MNRLIPITNIKDIPIDYQNTPIGLLLEYYNLNREFEDYSNDNYLLECVWITVSICICLITLLI